MSRSIPNLRKADKDLSPNGQEPGHTSSTEMSPPVADVEVVTEAERPEPSSAKPLSRFSAFVLDDGEDAIDEEVLLTTCPARQPRESDLFRVRPETEGEIWRMKTLTVDYRGDDASVPRGFYLIHPRLARVFSGLGKPYLLLTCITNHGAMFIWPIRIVEGFGDSWCKSRLRIAATAERQWVRVLGSSGNGYHAVVSQKDHGDPKWQGETLDELLAIAFDGKIVEELTHPLCQTFELS